MTSGGAAIRGTRIGASRIIENERGEMAPRRHVTYFCENGHKSEPSFAADAPDPETWDCRHCGLPAGRDETAPPPAPRTEIFKSHLAYVQERRTEAEGQAILDEALAAIRARRGG